MSTSHVAECVRHLRGLGIGLRPGAENLDPAAFAEHLHVAARTLHHAGLRLHLPKDARRVVEDAADDDQNHDGVDVEFHGKPDESYSHHLSAADDENNWIAEAAARVSVPAKDSAPAADEDWVGELAKKASDKQ